MCASFIKRNMWLRNGRVGKNGPTALVLAKPVFLKIKIKFHVYEKQVRNKQKC